MKQLLSIVVLSVLSVTGHAVTVEKTANLNVYYPEYTKIDLICGQMPKSSEKDVEFCCEAAFTGELLNEFKHTNIADNHICNGEMKKGYRCKANTGGFVWGKGNDVVAQDTIFSFLGKPIVINYKIYDQLSAIAAQDKMLSYSDSIIQIGDVRWRVNLMSGGIVLMTSVQPDDPKMKQVVKYLNRIYGKPYQDDEDEEDGYDIKWSSSDDPVDIFRPGSTIVRLRRVHSDEGGTFLFFD